MNKTNNALSVFVFMNQCLFLQIKYTYSLQNVQLRMLLQKLIHPLKRHPHHYGWANH